MTRPRVVSIGLLMIALACIAPLAAAGPLQCPPTQPTNVVLAARLECPPPTPTPTPTPTPPTEQPPTEEIPFFPSVGSMVLGLVGAAAIAGVVLIRRKS